MNSLLIKQSLREVSSVIDFQYPALGWYFDAEPINNSFVFRKNKWVCMFMYLKLALNKDKRIRFSSDSHRACTGPGEYFGFRELDDDGGKFIADTEQFKKSRFLAHEYYHESLKNITPARAKYLYMEKIENIDANREIEVVNLFPDPMGLARLTVLSNYDREKNMDNVIVPFASGCQSVFGLPFTQKYQEKPKSIIGLMDPLARQFIAKDMMVFSIPSNRFVEMVNNIKGSFLDQR